ncbi:MAG: hypothetical protein HN348_25810 [Proteobacteria bacterium]|jgi:uncharacterized protein|nr:hypothetical protein [Pseudomonadota bacterium]
MPRPQVQAMESAEPGATVLIQAGIHGDEIAGVLALEQMLDEGLHPERGRLIVIPVMNPAAYAANERAAPGGLDLNRCFPGDARDAAPERRLARRFMDLVLDERPALVCTLHESKKRYNPEVKPSFGQTIIYGVKPMPPVIGHVVERLNTNLESQDEVWAPQYYPVVTSSTEVIVHAIGCVGICVETWMGFSLERRIEMQKEVVGLLLDEFGIVAQEAT